MNKSLSIESKQVIVHNFIRTNIYSMWESHYKHNIKFLYQIIKHCFELNYFESRLIEHAAKELSSKPRFSNFKKNLEIYHILRTIIDDKLFDYPIEEYAEKIRQRLMTKEDFKWKYNFEENRFYTYMEMRAKREDSDLTNSRQTYIGISENPETDNELWHEHRINLILKRDHTKNLRKLKKLEENGQKFDINYANFKSENFEDNLIFNQNMDSDDEAIDDVEFLDSEEELGTDESDTEQEK